jgi:hypothetical protein
MTEKTELMYVPVFNYSLVITSILVTFWIVDLQYGSNKIIYYTASNDVYNDTKVHAHLDYLEEEKLFFKLPVDYRRSKNL